MSLHTLNEASRNEAEVMLQQCCTSDAWVLQMMAGRPFTDTASVFSLADRVWLGLTESDYLQAFDGHPKIGDVSSLKEKYANTKALASGEQGAVSQASDHTLSALALGNKDYELKFGFIFIVCASGKSAEHMMSLLQARIGNSREEELANAAEEQRKIFQLRLEKLL